MREIVQNLVKTNTLNNNYVCRRVRLLLRLSVASATTSGVMPLERVLTRTGALAGSASLRLLGRPASSVLLS